MQTNSAVKLLRIMKLQNINTCSVNPLVSVQRADRFCTVSLAKKETKRKPRKPKSPDADRCCAKACKNCFLNDYFDKMEKYEEKLAIWQAEQDESNKKKDKKPRKKTQPNLESKAMVANEN